VSTEGIVTASGRATPVKTRIMAGGYRATRQQIVRVDREPDRPIPPAARRSSSTTWPPGAARHAVVLSDYGYGTITGRLLDGVRELGARGVLVSADSRYELLRFDRLTAATPSEPEVEHLLGLTLDGEKAVEQAGWRLLERLGTRLLLVTRGSNGMALFERGGDATFLPIYGSDEIADVTGAGDTVISTFTLALAGGAGPLEAARLSNYAGGVVVMKRGTAPITCEDLRGNPSRRGGPRRSRWGRYSTLRRRARSPNARGPRVGGWCSRTAASIFSTSGTSATSPPPGRSGTCSSSG
jgi:rfaE bifunctional protein kinase chain/domain